MSRDERLIIRDITRVRGAGFLSIRDAKTGKLLDYSRFHNLDTSIGKNLMRDLYIGNSVEFPTHVALGINNTDPAVGDAALYNEKVRIVITSRSPAPGQATIRGYFGESVGNGETYNEAGLFTASNLLTARAIFTDIAKTASITITINWIKYWT